MTLTIRTKKNKKTMNKTLEAHILIDASGSMAGHEANVVKLLNEQIEEFQNNNNIATRVNIYSFSDTISIICANEMATDLIPIKNSDYTPDGNTALADALISVTDNCNQKKTGLIVLITDGQENRSKSSPREANTAIRTLLGSDNWTIAIACPPGAKQTIMHQYSIPEGSITEWETSKKGFNTLSTNMQVGTRSLYKNMSMGIKNSKSSYFTPDLNLSKKAMKASLDDVTSEFKTMRVNPGDMGPDGKISVSAFITGRGKKFEIGTVYYELTKTEKVQDYKGIVLMDVTTKQLYTSNDVRDLLNLPEGKTIDLNPAVSSKYKVFIRSTSWNRNLVPNTTVLLKK